MYPAAPPELGQISMGATSFRTPTMVSRPSKSPVDRENFDQRLSGEAAQDGTAIIKRKLISLEGFIVPKNVQIAKRGRVIKPSTIFGRGFCLWVICWLYLTLPEASALATTKGLNQIVTPDLQPQGDLSLSFQWQGEEIANPYEFQAELGITKWFEVAIFQGLRPQETIFGCEVGVVQKYPWLLTTGFVN